MQFINSLNPQFTVAMLFFTVYPLAHAYNRAIKEIDSNDFGICLTGLIAAILGWVGIIYGCILISQVTSASPIDISSIIAAFLLQWIITKRGKNFFLRYFLRPEKIPN